MGRKKLTIEFVKEQFELEGYELLSKEYVDAHTKLVYMCSEGHKHSISWDKWQQGRRCWYCRNDNLKGENSSCYGKLLSEEHKRKISKSMKGKYCGENHPMYGRKHSQESIKKMSMKHQNISEDKWKGFISSERDKDKHSTKYKDWRQQVFERDDYTCQKCDKKGVYLQAHHVWQWSDYDFIRHELWNGITLCGLCHNKLRGKEIHSAKSFFDMNMLKEHPNHLKEITEQCQY